MRFDIGQISNPVALEAATAHLRDQLGINGVSTALIDLLIVDRRWGSTIQPLVEVLHPDKVPGKGQAKQAELYAVYEDNKVIHLEMLKQERKKLLELNEKKGILCKVIITNCCSTKLQNALQMHKEYKLPKHAESIQVDIVKLINVIFEYVHLTDGNNTASTLLGSIFNEPIDDDNVGAFIRKKKLTFDTYKSIDDPTGIKSFLHVEEMIVKYLVDCRILPLQHIPLCCEIEELLRTSGTVSPDTFEKLINVIQRAQTIQQAQTSAYAIRQKQSAQSSPFAIASVTLLPTLPPTLPPTKPIDYSQACNKARDKALDNPSLLDTAIVDCGRFHCKYNHLSSAIGSAVDKYLERASKALAAKDAPDVTKKAIKYSQPSSPAPICIGLIGSAPAANQIAPWLPTYAILLDEGSHLHCANDTLMDHRTLADTQIKYVGTIGGWIPTNKCGIMQVTGLHCDYTPLAPFNIISKGQIKQDPNWILQEITAGLHSYRLTHRNGFSMDFLDYNGVYIHLPTPVNLPSMIQQRVVATSVTVPQQYIDNISQLTFSSSEKHGLLRIYPLLEGGLSYGEIETLIRTKHFTDITLSDIGNAQRVLGYDRSWISGNNRLSQTSTPIPPIPPNVRLQDITVTFDIGHIFKHNCLIGIGGHICDVQLLEGTNSLVTKRHLFTMVNRYHAAGFRVAAYSVDKGTQFGQSLSQAMEQIGIRYDPVYGGEHAATAETMIRVLKYKLRTLIVRHGRQLGTTNTYQIRHDLIKHAIAYVVQRYLMTVRKGTTVSPSEAITGTAPTYEDFALPFLTLVEISDASIKTQRNNTNIALTNTCLSLEPLGDGRGGYYFYNITTKAIIQRAHGSYVRLTRIDENIHQQYIDYINDTRAITPWNLDHITSEVDEAELGSTVFTRAVRYQPVNEVLHAPPPRNSTTDATPNGRVALETGVAQTTTTSSIPDIGDVTELGDVTAARVSGETGVAENTITPPSAVTFNDVVQVLDMSNNTVSPRALSSSTNGKAKRKHKPKRTINNPYIFDNTPHPSIQSTAPNAASDSHYMPEEGVVSNHVSDEGVAPSRPRRKSKPRTSLSAATLAHNAHNVANIMKPNGLFAIACATIFTAARFVCDNLSDVVITGATIRAQSIPDSDNQELITICNMGTFIPRFYHEIDNAGKIVGSTMIRTQKHDLVTGTLLGYKSRFIALGNQYQYNHESLETSSPTPRYEHILSLLLSCHHQGYIIKTGDVKNAYLQASLPPQSHYIRVDSKQAEILCQINPTWSHYRNNKGHMYCEVARALYGFEASGYLWHKKVTETLLNMGCVQNPREPCIFQYIDPKSNDKVYITVYVDDFLFAGSNDTIIRYITDGLTTAFGDIKIESGKRLSYLNILIDTSNPLELTLSMSQYKRDIVEGIILDDNVTTPCNHSTFDTILSESPRLSKDMHEFFHTKTAQILYLSNHLHGELCYYANKLCQRVNAPTIDDLQKLHHLLAYIKHNQDEVLTLDASQFNTPKIYIDASYATNSDYKSQSGLIMYFGRGSFICRSHKQHINVKSSTESELVALSDMSSVALGVIYFLQEFGIQFNSVTIYQDNKSTIKMLNKGYPDGKYSRHINIRSYWLKDLVQRNELQITYISTTDMSADIMTKALPQYVFKRFRDHILGRVLHHEIQMKSILDTKAIQDIDNISYSYIEGL